jgi:hypothetical protein
MKRIFLFGFVIYSVTICACTSLDSSQPEIVFGYYINGQDKDLTGGTNILNVDNVQLVFRRRGEAPIGIKIRLTNISEDSVELLLRESRIIHGDIKDALIAGSDPWSTISLGVSDALIEGKYDKYNNWYNETFYPRSRARVEGINMAHVPMNEPISFLIYFQKHDDPIKYQLGIDFLLQEN